MTASVLFLSGSKRRSKQRDDIRPVSGEGEDVSRALAGCRQVQFKYAPSIFDVGRRPKLTAYNGEGRKLGESIPLSLAPFVKKLRHAPASPSGLSMQPEGTFLFLSRNVNYMFGVRSALLTDCWAIASHKRQAGHP